MRRERAARLRWLQRQFLPPSGAGSIAAARPAYCRPWPARRFLPPSGAGSIAAGNGVVAFARAQIGFLPPSGAGSIAARQGRAAPCLCVGVPPAFRGGLHCGVVLKLTHVIDWSVPPAFRGGLHCGWKNGARPSMFLSSSSRLPGRAPLRQRGRRAGPVPPQQVPPASRGGLHCGSTETLPDGTVRTGSSRLPGRAPLRHNGGVRRATSQRSSSRLPGCTSRTAAGRAGRPWAAAAPPTGCSLRLQTSV